MKKMAKRVCDGEQDANRIVLAEAYVAVFEKTSK